MSKASSAVALLLSAACTQSSQTQGAGWPASEEAGFGLRRYAPPAGEVLAFGVRAGEIRNYFLRQGPVAVHLLTRSGPQPRLIAAFPANNQGIGVWFLPADAGTQLWAGAADEREALAAGGGLEALTGAAERRPLYGVRAILKSNAERLSAWLELLGNVRTLRDYGYGACLENAEQFPELRNERIERLPEQQAVRIRREQIGGGHVLELLLAGRAGTALTLADQPVPPRPGCSPGSAQTPAIEITRQGGIELELVALTDEAPLTPLEKQDLLQAAPPESVALDALAFLSYREKLLAGSWRFLTYFGRDTLIALRLLLTALRPEVVEAGLGAVLERIQLRAGAPAPDGQGALELGDVAHEEEIGDYAAWKNAALDRPPVDLRQPRYDYRMIDDDFLLAPVLAAYASELDAQRSSARWGDFLARTRSDGQTFEQALLANLALVLARARPFADDPRAPADKKERLVALRDPSSVGQWRDSEMGLAFGRYPFDVNAALVPAALEAAAALYTRLGKPAAAAEAARSSAAWQGVEELFRSELPGDAARANVSSYARSSGVADESSRLETDADGVFRYYGIALDQKLRVLPVLHSDHAFVLAYAKPSDAYLVRVAAALCTAFPSGLLSPVGVLVANPAIAAPGFSVIDPKQPGDPSDDVAVPLHGLFTQAHYHGTVVWSWQQALLAAGLRRQLARRDIAPATRRALERAECAVWAVIQAMSTVQNDELWSFAADAQGQLSYRPFGALRADADESNAIQLWSTVYLAVHPPTPVQNARCAPAALP